MNINKKKLFSTTGLVAAGVLLLAVNALSNIIFKSARLDFTENQLYTLSDGTRNILSALEEPVTLRFYFSESLGASVPQVGNYANRVRDLLEEYAALSKGKINLLVLDPEPFSDEEDQAVQYRLQGVPVDAAGTLLYFGLAGTNATDEQEIISFFQEDKEESLEYDLTKLVYNLANPKKKTVGLLSTLPLNSAPANPFMQPQQSQSWMIVDVITQTFNLVNVELSAETIPENVDILMVVHPKNLSDTLLYAIDQFVLKGGRLIAFVDPYAEADTPAPDPQNPMASFSAPRNSDMNKLIQQWGVELVDRKFAADRKNAVRVNVGGGGGRPQAMDYLAWLTLRDDSLAPGDFVTGNLKQLALGSAGILKSKNVEGITVTPLIETSETANAMDTSQLMMPNPAGLLSSFQPGSEKLMLAGRINGPVKSAFAEGKPGGGDAGLKESKEPINVIIVADTDFLVDKFWVNVQNFFGQRIAVPRADNGTFVVNALDNLSGSNDLISLRSRGRSTRPFTRVKELQREAEQRFLNKEKELQARLQETERRINELQSKKQGSDTLILSSEQQQEITKFRAEQVKTRKELRSVQHELRGSIEALGSFLKFINIGLIPILILAVALGMSLYRYRQQQV